MRRWGWLCLGWLVAVTASAQDIPPALKDWQGWVLRDAPTQACPLLASGGNKRSCTWAGPVHLDVQKDGAHFAFDVRVDAPSWVKLPGDARAWPQGVTVDGKPVAVLERGNEPAIWLEAGSYGLRGDLPWTTRPTGLHVSADLVLVDMRIDGAAVTRLERHGAVLTLGEAAATQRQADALSVRVYRGVWDGLPANLETRIIVNVTGSAREQWLGPVLPKGFVATNMESNLPARLESDGRMRVQLRPGEWTIRLDARSLEPLGKIALSLPPAPWPRQEIWSYAAESDRNSHAEGEGVDPTQSGVPSIFSDLPAFMLDQDHGLTIDAGSRAGEGGRSDDVHLHHDIWLSFDGGHYSVSDQLWGALYRSLRLDVAAPWQLQSASVGDTPLLITQGADGRSGVEVRQSIINLNSGLQIPRGGSLPATGWQLPLSNVTAQLHLPPGYRLIGAPGTDVSPDSWVAHWSLLDLFVVALMTLLAGRLLGWRWAVIAAVFLVLSQHESNAPRWTLALVLALSVLARALGDGKLQSISRAVAGAVLVLTFLWTLPFAALQLKYALHPQLEVGGELSTQAEAGLPPPPGLMPAVEEASTNDIPAPPAPPPPAAPATMARDGFLTGGYARTSGAAAPESPDEEKAQSLAGLAVVAPHAPSGNKLANEIGKRSIVQAGNGKPAWFNGPNYRMAWTGPVTNEESFRLVIAPSWMVRLLRVLMLVTLGLLLANLTRLLWKAMRPMGVAGLRFGAVALIFACALPHVAHAQAVPDQTVLDQLRTQLTQPPTCAPNCAKLAALQVSANADQITLDLEYHAGTAVSVPLPQVRDALALQDVVVDGKSASLNRDAGTSVRVDRGVHRVTARYRAFGNDEATLEFHLRPEHVGFSGQGWKMDGVEQGRALGNTLSLSRIQSSGDGKEVTIGTQVFPSYVRVVRTLLLGPEWTMETTVERIAPKSGGFTTGIPLIPGEHPLVDESRVHDGLITATFSAQQYEVTWTSRLDRAVSIALTAPALGERTETWDVQASPSWHVDAKGVPVEIANGAQVFHPLPGETLQLAVSEPKAIDGDSLAIDHLRVYSEVGDRATSVTLELTARSTRGGEHFLALPKGAELLEVDRDDDTLSLALRDDKLGLPLLPGTHIYTVKLRLAQGVSGIVRTMPLVVGAPTANLSLELDLPKDRWLLWAWGPSMGPAVLYWSQLIVLLIVAWLLGRFAPTPLRSHHWLLLGLGFSAFAWSAYALVVAWLIVFGLRQRCDMTSLRRWMFNLAQVLLAVLTVAALVVLVGAVPQGLLGVPDMHVEGNAMSGADLAWFADQARDAVPQGGVFSVPLWVYKVAMLAWALWLANALLGWLRWVFQAWSHGGYWRKREAKSTPPPPPESVPHA
ncbi:MULTISPECIES: hypothetical protein [Dyella]|uniref:Uncharacterized protein n=2 Tax=Dyella TaxID=231454 RepID=A0A4R0YHI9_9GAMM|nr:MULTISPECIES: hypothetical protein [Dyella]TBR37081.1 hypothetical protein EYV96_14435 [Dyella terrae]TCI07829.1 hypothetical protein EZM97_24435 [Dyella soli]